MGAGVSAGPGTPGEWARWDGELLWPQELALGDHLDCRGLVSLGVWAHDLLKARPGTTLVGCNDRILKQLDLAGVPIRKAPAALAAGQGVSAAERRDLFSLDAVEPADDLPAGG